MDTTITEKEIKNLINDIDFEEIELGLKNPNIFRILKISRTEIRHSNFLAWLLDPIESHNLRDSFLRRFLFDISVNIEMGSIDNIEIRREWRNIDILIIADDFVICIENKVDSFEHSDQLIRYKKIVKESFPTKEIIFVYLTANQSSPSDVDYTPYSYKEIVDILEKVTILNKRGLTNEVLQYMNDYIEIIKLEIMQDHKLSKLAVQLYNRHKDVFEFVFQNKPDIATFFSGYFKQEIEKRGWIVSSDIKGALRFLTPKLKQLLPEMEGWNPKECFGFELDYFWSNQKWVIFKTTIVPGKGNERDEKIREILLNSLLQVKGAKNPKGKKWLVPIIIRQAFDLEEMSKNDEKEIKLKIVEIFNNLESSVNEVEKAIMTNSDKLIESEM